MHVRAASILFELDEIMFFQFRALRASTLAGTTLAAALFASPSNADDGDHHGAPSPSSHAPAGVMADHMHKAGEFMVGYRFMYSYSGATIIQNGNKIGDNALADAGFSTTPQSMSMYMHMLDIMYAPTDRLTLMVMPQYMEMDMVMRPVAGAMAGHDAHGGHTGMTGTHAHGTSGIGDTVVSGLVRLWNTDTQHLHATLGISAPTGSVSQQDANGVFTHYMMQLGSGTWDFVPNITYTADMGSWNWGAQLGATIRMENANSSGFSFGDIYQATAWASRDVNEWMSASLRLAFMTQGQISGHYNGPHNHSSPPDLQANYGGDFIDIGLGINTVVPSGSLKGHRFGFEITAPLLDDPKGFQQERKIMLHIGWSKAF